jgi:hypothetical protein
MGKYTNTFANGEVTGYNPDAVADYYEVTDHNRDSNYWHDRISDALKAMSNNPTKDFHIIYGGVVTDSGSGQVDISAGVAVGKDASGNVRMVTIPALTNISLPTGWDNNRQIWVVGKYDYTLDTPTRQHAETQESYRYILEDSYVGNSDSDNLFVDSDPGDTAVIWGSFKMNVTTFTDFSVGERTRDLLRLPSISAVYSSNQTFSSVAHFNDLHITANCTINARIIIVEGNFTIDSGVTVTFIPHTNLLGRGLLSTDNNLSLSELMCSGRLGQFGSPPGGGYGGYTTATVSSDSHRAGSGGYTTEGGDGWSSAIIGGLPFIDIAKFGLSTGIGGDGGNGAAAGAGGGGGVGAGGGRGTDDGGNGGPAILIIVKGDFINNGTITANGNNPGSTSGGGGGGGLICVIAYGENNTMGTMNAIGGNSTDGGGGGGGHIATLRASGSAPTTSVIGGTSSTGSAGSSGTTLNLDLRTNPEYGLASWGSTDAGILTANFIYQVFGYGWSVYA